MGTARDRSPDLTRTTNWVRPPLPTGPRGTASTPSSPAPPPFGRQPKLLDRLRDAHLACHYSPRTEQSRPVQDAARGCEGSTAEAPRSRALDPSAGPGRGIWQWLLG